jgi:hypothetical protein
MYDVYMLLMLDIDYVLVWMRILVLVLMRIQIEGIGSSLDFQS